MDTHSGMGAMSQGTEKPRGLEIEPVDGANVEEYLHLIQRLAYNAREGTLESTLGDREKSVGDLLPDYLETGKGGHLAVLKNTRGEVVGFIALRKESSDHGVIGQLRLAAKEGQENNFEELLVYAKHYFESVGCHHVSMEGENPDSNLVHIVERDFTGFSVDRKKKPKEGGDEEKLAA